MPRRQIALEEEFGPAMRALTAQEQMFVCLLFSGIQSATKCADQAGLRATSRGALRVQAHRLLHRSDVAAAVVEESKRRTVFLMPRAQTALADLLNNPQHSDHFHAIKMVREESGLSAVVRRAIDVNVNFNDMGQQEKVRHIVAFAEKRGIDPKTLLGFDPGETIDAEFTEVDDIDRQLIEALA